jgi:hypothetical protein
MLPQFGIWIRKVALALLSLGMIRIDAGPSTIIGNSLNRRFKHA